MFENLFRKKSISHILSDADSAPESTGGMKRNLRVFDLTALGVAAIIGAGIFSTIGNAAASGGPAVTLLFVFTAIACGLSAMCYAEFAASIPISGSAYTYAYASFGELIAWIIGWDLIMEYAIGNIAVAISWSGYFTGLMAGLGLNIPEFLSTDYLTASRGYEAAVTAMNGGTLFTELSPAIRDAFSAWTNSPQIGGFHIIADIPALMIVFIITWICYIGIRESRITNNFFVILKVAILLLVIGIGAFYVKPENWSPFAPNGISGVLKGISGVFFAYIGFDAISTTAEECKNPRRDLPLSMFYALLITTVLYVMISLVLTGMVPYYELGVSDPMAFVFNQLHLTKLSGIIAAGAVIAMASVLLVFQLGQPRIWMSMSRDGLLPPIFSRLHPKFRTPAFATIVTGLVVAIPSLFMNLTEVTDLTSIGTLFAFILVSGGIIALNPTGKQAHDGKGFRVPYADSRRYLLPLWIVILFVVWKSGFGMTELFSGNQEASGLFGIIRHHFPFLIFCIVSIIITFQAVAKRWSLIPVLGLLTNLYLMSQLGVTNWFRFGIWLLIGLIIYFLYGAKHSKLKNG
ncbi:MAG: amino acid transporter [Bacteroidetes bacterium GWB2_41_8]|nr:MAG: amino acid transporter [Bacteroidetes bacterium GWB2_41_8]